MTHTPPLNSPAPIRLASLSILAGGALWGLFWVPVRFFEQLGLTGPWPGLVIYISALILIAPFMLRTRSAQGSLRPLAIAGLLTGAAFTFYGTAIVLTDVLRALLFFYLTPVWGTAIGVIFLGERLTWARALAVGLAIAGLLTVVGFGTQASLNLGDLMALASGMFWAVGSYKIFKLPKTPTIHLSAAFLMGSIIVTGLLIALGSSLFEHRATFPPLATLWPYALMSGLFAVPMIMLTLWPTSILSPGRIGILLMSEILVGIASAALFAGEAIGPYEAIGAFLIVSAAITEIFGNRS